LRDGPGSESTGDSGAGEGEKSMESDDGFTEDMDVEERGDVVVVEKRENISADCGDVEVVDQKAGTGPRDKIASKSCGF
jgi:hypothetical protein